MSKIGSNLYLEYLSDLQSQAQADDRECVVGGLITNQQGEIFIQKRSPDRELFPGRWDIAGGKVENSETLYQTLAREIQEETGWVLTRIVDIVGTFDWEWEVGQKVVREREFDFLVEVEGDLDNPKIEWAKFTEFRWVSRSDLKVLETGKEDNSVIFGLIRQALAITRKLHDNSDPEIKKSGAA